MVFRLPFERRVVGELALRPTDSDMRILLKDPLMFDDDRSVIDNINCRTKLAQMESSLSSGAGEVATWQQPLRYAQSLSARKIDSAFGMRTNYSSKYDFN